MTGNKKGGAVVGAGTVMRAGRHHVGGGVGGHRGELGVVLNVLNVKHAWAHPPSLSHQDTAIAPLGPTGWRLSPNPPTNRHHDPSPGFHKCRTSMVVTK